MTKTQTMAVPTQSYVILLIGICSASMAAIFIRLAQGEGIPSLVIAAGRLIVATLILTPAVIGNSRYMAQIRQLSPRDLRLIGLSGLFLALHFAAWVTSLEYTTVLISVVLVTTGPIWVAILEVLFLQARLPQLVVYGLIVALMGGLIIGLSGGASTDGNQLLGGLLSTLGAVAVAVYLVIGRKVRASMSLTPYIWMVYGFAALILMVMILFTGTQVTGYSAIGYGWIVAMGIFAQLIGHSAFNYALAYLPATYISVATQAESLLSTLFAFIVFREVPGLGQVLGGLVIVSGVILASFGQAQTNRKNAKVAA